MDAHSRVVESIKLLGIMMYSGEELAALIQMGTAMLLADGKVAEEEKEALGRELLSFGVKADNVVALLSKAQDMSFGEAIGVLSSMSEEQKKYATGFLAKVMVADGEIDDSELALWKLVSTLGGFPTMNIAEALAYWTSH